MKGKTNKEKSSFGRRLKKYIMVLCVLSFIFLMYVLNTLFQYEQSFTDNFMAKYVKSVAASANKGHIERKCDINNITINKLDTNKDDAKKAIEEIVKTSNISYKLNSKKNAQEPVYGIYANDEKIMDATLKVKKNNQRLGLFSYPTWEVKECKVSSDRGIYYYDLLVPDNYSVKVNGTKLDNSYISDSATNENYNVLAKYVELPKLVNYKLDNFITKPDIIIENSEGKKVDYTIKNHKVELTNNKTAGTYDEAKQYLAADLDILDIAQKWSLFLTDDLKGNRHGFNNLTQYLINGTSLYDMAYSWATSIDITFTSVHTLKNPTFTNTKVSDFEIYGENAFTCTVYLEKNMTIANGNDKVDVMHDKLYFVYYDDTDDGKENPTWKLVEMKSLANE